MTVALVTGGYGWVGGHLRRLLVDSGYDVVALGRTAREPVEGERYQQVDLTKADQVTDVVRSVRPDVVFHLAAAMPQRVREVSALVEGCVTATFNVCAALRSVASDDAGREPVRLVLAGSSAQYGLADPGEGPMTESTRQRPASPYGHAKVAAEEVALALAADDAFSLVAVRAFNHIGPGEPAATVAGSLARRIADVVHGRADRIRVVDVASVRDFTDVRDVARGYLALAERGASGGTYNLCSGRGVAVEAVLDHMLVKAGLDWSIVDVVAGSAGSSSQIGSPALVHSDAGWAADIPLEVSVADLLTELLQHDTKVMKGV